MLSSLKLFNRSSTAGSSSEAIGRASSTRSQKSTPDLLPNKASEEVITAAHKVSRFLPRQKMQVGFDAPAMDKFSIFENVHPADKDELLRLAHKDVQGRRCMGALVCMAVADSIGHNFEFLPVGQKGSSWNPRTLRATGVYNKFNLKAGQWTDDTSMGLCLADSLLCSGGYDGTDQRVRFWNWWNRGYNNAFRLDNERKGSVGLGTNIAASLSAITNADPPPRFEAISEDSGNGSLMRLAPIPVYYHKDMETAIEASIESSFTTHPGPIAANACGFLGYLIMRAIRRKSRTSIKKFLDSAVEEYLARPEVQNQRELVRLLKSNEPANSTERCWNWRDAQGPYLAEVVKARGAFYNGYPVSSGYMGAFSMDGLAIAMHSLYHTSSLMGAIAKCVNCLGDADSTGAICGQVAGAFYGVDAIDSRLIENLRKWDSGDIALRGALLWALGENLPSEDTLGSWKEPMSPKRMKPSEEATDPKAEKEETKPSDEVPEEVPEVVPEKVDKVEKKAPKKDLLTLPIGAVDNNGRKVQPRGMSEITESGDEAESCALSKVSEDDVAEDLDEIQSQPSTKVELDPTLSPARIRTQLADGEATLMRECLPAEVQDEPRQSARGEKPSPFGVIAEVQAEEAEAKAEAQPDCVKAAAESKQEEVVEDKMTNIANFLTEPKDAAIDTSQANKAEDSTNGKNDEAKNGQAEFGTTEAAPKSVKLLGPGPCPRGPSCFQLPTLPDVEQLDHISDPVPPCPLPRVVTPAFNRPTLPAYNGKPAAASGHKSLPPGTGAGRTPFIQSI